MYQIFLLNGKLIFGFYYPVGAITFLGTLANGLLEVGQEGEARNSTSNRQSVNNIPHRLTTSIKEASASLQFFGGQARQHKFMKNL